MTDAPRAVFVLTASIAPARMMAGQCRFFREAGFDVSVIASPGPELEQFGRREGVRIFGVPIARRPAPAADLVSLWRIFVLLLRLRPDVVEVGTPKAGLLGGLAAWLARVPVRLYTLHGLRAETLEGLPRRLALGLERLACSLAGEVVCVSESLRECARELGVLRQARVLGEGSANGVDTARFQPRRSNDEPLTLGFAGRLARDKGVEDLLETFERLRGEIPGLRLLLLGDFDASDPLSERVRRRIADHPAVMRPGWVDDVERWYPKMSLLVLPTRREGLPQTVLEAAACEVPAVAYRATGTVDAIVDRLTGRLVEPAVLADALAALLKNRPLREQMGRNARRRVERHFAPERIWREKLALWRELARKPAPSAGRELLRRAAKAK